MEWGVTARRCSFIAGDSTRALYEKPKPDKDEQLKEALKSVWRPNMGYRLAHGLVKGEFAPLNVKRVHRVWKEERLGRMKRYRKKRSGKAVPYSASYPNEVWTMDFVHDSCLNGTKLKILSVVDEVTRECLALEFRTTLNSRAVRAVLEPVMKKRGAPSFVLSDNGGEFISRLLAVFLSEEGLASKFIELGKPWQNGFVESFHSTLRRVYLDVEALHNLAYTQMRTAIYRKDYNEVRPHSSLGDRPPPVAGQDWKAARTTPSHLPNLDLLQS